MKKSKLATLIRNYSRTVIRSVTDLRFFRGVKDGKLSRAVRYIIVLLILFWVIPFSIMFFTGMRAGLDSVLVNLRKNFPAETEFEIKDGKFSNNLEQPVVFNEDGFKFIVNTATSTLVLEEDEIGFVLSEENISSKDSPYHLESVSYSQFPDFKIDRLGIDDWIGKYAKWVILLAATVSLLFFSVGIFIGYGFYVSVHAFLLWLVLKMIKRRINYTKTLVVATYAATMPIIIKSVFSWSNIEIGAVATYIYWVLLAFIAYDFFRGGETDGPKKEGSEESSPKNREGRS